MYDAADYRNISEREEYWQRRQAESEREAELDEIRRIERELELTWTDANADLPEAA